MGMFVSYFISKQTLKNMIKKLIFILLILILSGRFQTCLAQVMYEEPPKMLMPNKENTILINKIIEITEFDKYFEKFCLNQLKEKTKSEKLSKEKVKQLKAKIQLDLFKYKIYNILSNYKTEELNSLIEKYEKDKNCKNNNILTENKDIQNGLKQHAKFMFS